jgi:uncharacterized protein
MILETIVSTLDLAGNPNFAPMGIVLEEDYVTLRPYRDTTTYRNLTDSGFGVANVTDDVLAFVRCGLYKEVLPHFAALSIPGVVFQGTCYWQEFAVESQGGSGERAELLCRVLYKGRLNDFGGLCRAKAAVLEAAILASRMFLCDRNTIEQQMVRYREIVEKTGDEPEKLAFQLAHDFIRNKEE